MVKERTGRSTSYASPKNEVANTSYLAALHRVALIPPCSTSVDV